jgi:hypothetical protein
MAVLATRQLSRAHVLQSTDSPVTIGQTAGDRRSLQVLRTHIQCSSTFLFIQWLPKFLHWRYRGRGVKCTTDVHLLCRLRASGTVCLRPTCAFMERTGTGVYVCYSPFLGAFAKLRKKRLLISCLSVRPHGTTPLPLDGFSWNLIFEDFSKICPEDSNSIKIWQQ